MSKENLKLARQIVERHGNVTLVEDQIAPNEIDKDGNMTPSEKKVYKSDMPIIAMGFGSIAANEKDAIDDITKQLAGELDSGALSLSDDWASTNL